MKKRRSSRLRGTAAFGLQTRGWSPATTSSCSRSSCWSWPWRPSCWRSTWWPSSWRSSCSRWSCRPWPWPMWRTCSRSSCCAVALLALDLLVAALPLLGLAVEDVAVDALAAAVASALRVDLESAARALPAAVCSPLALLALPAAMRTLAALAAALLLTWRCGLVDEARTSPPRAALTRSIRRLLRRAALLGWMAPTLAAWSSAAAASATALRVASASPAMAACRASLTSVLAAERRGCRMALRRLD